jgi:hypothetical protein
VLIKIDEVTGIVRGDRRLFMRATVEYIYMESDVRFKEKCWRKMEHTFYVPTLFVFFKCEKI